MAEKKELKKSKPPGKHPALFVLLALCAVLIVMSVSPSSQPLLFEVPQKLSTRLSLENFRNVAGPEPRTPSVHAISLIPLPEGRLLAAWFGGSREGAADVAIYGSSFDGLNWSESRVLIDINQLLGQSKQAARKLGNPVLHLDRSGFFAPICHLGCTWRLGNGLHRTLSLWRWR